MQAGQNLDVSCHIPIDLLAANTGETPCQCEATRKNVEDTRSVCDASLNTAVSQQYANRVKVRLHPTAMRSCWRSGKTTCQKLWPPARTHRTHSTQDAALDQERNQRREPSLIMTRRPSICLACLPKQKKENLKSSRCDRRFLISTTRSSTNSYTCLSSRGGQIPKKSAGVPGGRRICRHCVLQLANTSRQHQ